MLAPSLEGDDPATGLGEGAPPGKSVIPASGTPAALVTLILEAIIGVLEGVPVAGPGLFRLRAGAQALQAGERPLIIIKAVNEARRILRHCSKLQMPLWSPRVS